jgi:hypothetical protein
MGVCNKGRCMSCFSDIGLDEQFYNWFYMVETELDKIEGLAALLTRVAVSCPELLDGKRFEVKLTACAVLESDLVDVVGGKGEIFDFLDSDANASIERLRDIFDVVLKQWKCFKAEDWKTSPMFKVVFKRADTLREYQELLILCDTLIQQGIKDLF